MKKFVKYIGQNWRRLLISVNAGFCFAFVICHLFPEQWGKAVLTVKFSTSIYLITGAYILLLVVVRKSVLTFWRRYRNNFSLKDIPFTYIEPLVLFLVSSCFTGTACNWRYIKNFQFFDGIIWIMILVAILILWLFSIVVKGQVSEESKLERNKPQESDVFPDEPITEDDEDLLDRIPFVNDLYNQIVSYPSSESFVFGLHGSWGEGKTSIINLLRTRLQKNRDILVYAYDPWYFSSQEAVIKGFYDGLYRSLNSRYFLPNLRKLITKYQKVLLCGLKLSGLNLDFAFSDESIDELKRKIEFLISLTGKRVVIIVDDIDRLHDKNEIMEIFKIIKLSARINNTIFLVSFDQNLVLSYLKEDTALDSSFIEKIIQNPIHIPAPQQSMIDKFLFFSFPDQSHISAIDRLFQKLNIDKERVAEFDNEFVSFYQSHIKRLFPTLRRAKRYLNGLYSTLPIIKNEVNLQDFLILELIRIFYPKVYKDIWYHPWYYISLSWSMDNYLLSPFTFDKDNKLKIIKEHINNLVKEENESDILTELLKTIFFIEVKNSLDNRLIGHDGMSEKYRMEKRIAHPKVFPKYFALRVPIGEISDEATESLISEWNASNSEEKQERIDKSFQKHRKEHKVLEFIDKLILFVPRFNEDSANSMVRFIYKNINSFSKEGRQNFWHDEYDRARLLILHLIDQIIAKNKIQSTVSEIIKETESLELAVSIIQSCSNEGHGSFYNIYENINIDDLRKALSHKLANYFIDGKKDIFLDQSENRTYNYILYRWGIGSREDRQTVNDYVFSLIDKNPKYIGKIILSFIIKWDDSSGRQIEYEDLIKHYDENRLYKAIKTFSSNSFSNDEEKSAVDLFCRVYEEKQKLAVTKLDAPA